MSANRWYKDSTLARDCQGCTSKIHALAIACRKIPHTIGNKAAAREIPARPVTPHPSRKASGFPQAQRRKRSPFARHPPKPEGRRFAAGATRKKAPSRPVTPPKPEGLRFPQAQRERRPRPGHPTQTGRAAIFRRRNAKEGPRSRAPPKPEGRWFPQARREKRPPARAAPAQTRRPAIFRRHVAEKDPALLAFQKESAWKGAISEGATRRQASARAPHPNRKDGGFPQARRGGRPPPGPQAGRAVVSAGTTRKKAPARAAPAQTRRPAIFRRRDVEKDPALLAFQKESARKGAFPAGAIRKKAAPALGSSAKPEGRQFSTGATRKKAPSRPVTPTQAGGAAALPCGRA